MVQLYLWVKTSWHQHLGTLNDDKIHVFRADDINNPKLNKELRKLDEITKWYICKWKRILKNNLIQKWQRWSKYGVVNPLKSGAKTVAEDQFQENILKQVKSQQRKFSAAEITEFQQLLSQSIESKRRADLSEAVKH